MTNQIIRAALAENRLYLWQLAEALGISESALSRMIRRELPGDVVEKILHVIECKKQPSLMTTSSSGTTCGRSISGLTVVSGLPKTMQDILQTAWMKRKDEEWKVAGI